MGQPSDGQSVATPELEYGPCVAAAIAKKRSSEASSVVHPVADADAAPQGHMAQRSPTVLGPVDSQPARFNISSGSSGTTTPTVADTTHPTEGAGYGKAPRGRQPFCNKCWSISCRCALPSPCPTEGVRTGQDGSMGTSETAMVVWQPPKDRAELLQQLTAANARQAERARGRAENAPPRPSPY